jgi:chromosome segregation ATPase
MNEMSSDRLTEILNYLSAISRDIGAFRSETNKRLEALDARMDRLEVRMDRLEVRVENLETRMGNLETRIGNLDKRIGNLETRHGNLETEMLDGFRKLHRKFDVLTTDSIELRAVHLKWRKESICSNERLASQIPYESIRPLRATKRC